MKYSEEKNILYILSYLKEFNIKKIIISPGSLNYALVRSFQIDKFFELYSAVDERSASYMAVGLAIESNEPVVISCTGATASRNYLPGITEAFYRNVPILAITGSMNIDLIGQEVPQLLDRTQFPKDTYKSHYHLDFNCNNDDWVCKNKINSALNDLISDPIGPVQLNLTTMKSIVFNVSNLPIVNRVQIVRDFNNLPILNAKKITIFVGNNSRIDDLTSASIENFCRNNNAVVLCDHTSNYKGKYRILSSIIFSQRYIDKSELIPDLAIYIGGITGDYSSSFLNQVKRLWKFSHDNKLKDRYKNLENVITLPYRTFFDSYNIGVEDTSYFKTLSNLKENLYSKLPKFNFSNIWIANYLHTKLPMNSVVHFGILNSLRSWNFFDIDNSILSYSNVGGFGIDGCLSTLLGASLSDQQKLFFGIVGDLAFFYDLNSLGNRHVGKNLRIILVNNGKGTEFKNFNNPAALLGKSADEFTAAAGHNGEKSKSLVRDFAKNLNFEYISANNQYEFKDKTTIFLDKKTEKSIIFEVFTNDENESKSLEKITSLIVDESMKFKKHAKSILGDKNINKLRNLKNRKV